MLEKFCNIFFFFFNMSVYIFSELSIFSSTLMFCNYYCFKISPCLDEFSKLCKHCKLKMDVVIRLERNFIRLHDD